MSEPIAERNGEAPNQLIENAVQRVGILGGGQLAKMIAEAALRHGLQPIVLGGSRSDPAASCECELIVGALDDASSLSELASSSNVVTLENEFLDVVRLSLVLDQLPEVQLQPGLGTIAVAQDKLRQRRLFQRLAMDILEYELVHSSSLHRDLRRTWKRFPEGFVLKWSRFGYDGRGNLTLRPHKRTDLEAVAEFCRRGEARGATVYAEQWVDFVRELAMVSTRAKNGDQVYFPLMISRQENGVCREVLGPATSFGQDATIEWRAQEIARAIAKELDLVGSFALEFFLDRSGRLLINEMAPRVHNTGHFSLFENEPSQFDLHVQAVAGLPLSRPSVHGVAVMRNILGPWETATEIPCTTPEESPPGTSLVWYGKQMASPGRKMGHVTGRARNAEAALDLLQRMAMFEADYWSATCGLEATGVGQ
ncbi:MAG: ATP-grasp domain-containing protein [Candidatus Eisenbacteria bacterium]|uniref:N5-carboxyaminoimidazole ribonucleotide synthase n=1 Tax=Eiseniibacteriota bacterium TaxID=2212470 RepID=A0A956NEZ3_UNCEI|nr:ATP-grasp domain-containing protein [Candidatus Eisenbacteria bacterium]